MTIRLLPTALAVLLAPVPVLAQPAQMLPAPAAIRADGVPPLPASLRTDAQPYLEARSASFVTWDPKTRGMLVATRFGNTAQLHAVKAPGMARTQISFEAEPLANGAFAPKRADVLLVAKDVGGDEYYQLHALNNGRLRLLTDGKSRNSSPRWSDDGRLVAFTSTRRTGADADIWVMDPREPASARMLLQREGGGWQVIDWSPDGRQLLLGRYVSAQESQLFLADANSGAVRRIDDPKVSAAYGDAAFAPDGTLWVTADIGSDFQRLGVLDPANGRFTPRGPAISWDVDSFEIDDAGTRLAMVSNEDGTAVLRVMDLRTGRVTQPAGLPAGVIGGLEWSPWGVLGFTLSAATTPADAYSYDPANGAVARWTASETGGLDPAVNRAPELVRTRSFDGLSVSGYLYRPDPAKFPGKRPLIVSVHGGPEGQSRPGFQGRTNYLVNELGVAVFFPNVRGSSGYGKKFIGLDNGPFRREDSVKDLAALTRVLKTDARIDPARVGVTGGSYGGYMTYAALTLYPELWRAGVAVVAISDFNTFLTNTADYRRDLRRVEYGDERDPAQRAKLAEISPLARAGRIVVPLMVVTGGRDPRVPASEADQMVAAVRKNGREAWHVLAANEGHGFAKKENQDYQFFATLEFWKRHLLN